MRQSHEQLLEYWRKYNKEVRKKKITIYDSIIISCPVCGKLFMKNHKSRNTCSDECKKINRRFYNTKYVAYKRSLKKNLTA
ncbi:hypothetical protein [Clostridium beijerinckii]|jgi:ribosomal protein S27AE|uniref:hypothetical protein n=1 Tax=Clostridium beijerinckii TaxID=1520 RepID=UPI00156D609C|nr:hypothetical protein [Clostridium beijerinckii]NRU52462.1 ribosomal protein S27AE [Clostridium beijerinckii]NYC69093.1 ribosomal protein S27AE [Clostridium beijerinckii]